MNSVKIAPSILSADFSKMGEELKRMEISGADIMHCDVMDGVFVPNITFGIKMVSDLKKCTDIPLDVHLMIVKPEKYVSQFINAGADYLTFHIEALEKPIETLQFIRSQNVKSGIVISPDTEVERVRQCLKYCDIVLLMSVYPGFGGQKFIEKSYERLRELKRICAEVNPEIEIEIDGGITLENSQKVIECGANILVAGNTIFSSQDPSKIIRELRGGK